MYKIKFFSRELSLGGLSTAEITLKFSQKIVCRANENIFLPEGFFKAMSLIEMAFKHAIN